MHTMELVSFLPFLALSAVIKTNLKPPHHAIVAVSEAGVRCESVGGGGLYVGGRSRGHCYHFAKLQGSETKETELL